MLGELSALGTAICWAAASSLYVIGMKDTSPFLANAIKTLTGGLFSLIIVIFWDDIWSVLKINSIHIVFLVIITILNLGIGDWLYFRSLKIA